MVARNERKIEILELLATTGARNVLDLSTELGCTYPNIGMALFRYHKMGLLSRRKTDGTYSYAINLKGLSRLSWLNEN